MSALLYLKCDDEFPSLHVRCAGARGRLGIMKSQGGFNTSCSYSFRGFSPKEFRIYGDKAALEAESEGTFRYDCELPVFFEQTDFTIILQFPAFTEEARLFSPIAGLCEKALNGWDPDLKRLDLALNFGNELGDFELCFEWKAVGEGDWRICSFRAQVFSTKLDVASHFRVMLEEVAERFDWLKLDMLRQTFWGWSYDADTVATQQTWLIIFQEVRQEMGLALRQLTERHRRRLRGNEYWLRPERIKRLASNMEEKAYRALIDKPDSRLRVARQILDTDTPENRYIKHIFMQCLRQLGVIGTQLESNDKFSDVFRQRLGDWEEEWMILRHKPFWNSIGAFRGLRGESLILSRDPLYVSIRRNWRLLKEGLALLDQDLKGGLQNAAQLYEIWCLVQLDKFISSHENWISKEENLTPFEGSGDDWNNEERHSGTVRLKYNYTDNDNLYLELLFQPSAGRKPNLTYWNGVMALPESQCPDIVMRLHRNDLPSRPVYTWIFDAKYRIQSDKSGNHTGAPKDTIDGMHRYRDAILWAADTEGEDSLLRESLGAFVLYPGRELVEESQNLSISRVNVGTFSLRPPKVRSQENNHSISAESNLADKINAFISPSGIGDAGEFADQEKRFFKPVPKVRSSHLG